MIGSMDMLAFEESIAEEYELVASRTTDEIARGLLANLRDEHVSLYRYARKLEQARRHQSHQEEAA